MARGKGEGSVHQRADGMWIGAVEMGYTPTGRKRRYVSAKTKSAVLVKMGELRKEVEQGVTATSTTVEAWMQYWLDTICVQRGLKPTTLQGYRSYVDTWIVPHLGHFTLKKLAPGHVRALYQAMRDAGRAEAAVRQCHAILRRALLVAQREGRMTRNVATLVDPPGTAVTPHEKLTPMQARKVLKAARTSRELARLTCALVLGIRQGEALGLQWSSVDLSPKGGAIEISASLQRVIGQSILGTPKSSTSVRMIPVPAVIAQALLPYAEHPDDPVWVFPGSAGGQETNPRRDWELWTEALERAGVPHVPLHGARGSAASLLLDLGVPDRMIADILGHSDVRVTQQHYLVSQEKSQRKALEKAAKRIGLGDIKLSD